MHTIANSGLPDKDHNKLVHILVKAHLENANNYYAPKIEHIMIKN